MTELGGQKIGKSENRKGPHAKPPGFRPSQLPALTAIFDIGKTNKKFLLFNNAYEVVFEKSINLPETQDEDGDSCEDLQALTGWVKSTFEDAIKNPDFNI